MNVGIVGFGRMGTRLLEASLQANLPVTSILDTSPNPWGLSHHPEYTSALKITEDAFFKEQFDILAVATTAPSHTYFLKQGLDHGIKRFVIEKPFSTSLHDAQEAHDLSASCGAKVIVNHARRYCPNFAQLLLLKKQKKLGNIKSINTVLGGGSMGCLGVHFFDLYNWLYEALPTKVVSTLTEPVTENVRGAHFFDPGGSVFLSYPCGGRAFLDIGDDIGIMGGTRIIFEKGIVEIDAEFETWSIRGRKPEDMEKPNTQYGLPLVPRNDLLDWKDFSMMDRWSAMMADAASDEPGVSGSTHGIDTLKIYHAARISAAENKWVDLNSLANYPSQEYLIP